MNPNAACARLRFGLCRFTENAPTAPRIRSLTPVRTRQLSPFNALRHGPGTGESYALLPWIALAGSRGRHRQTTRTMTVTALSFARRQLTRRATDRRANLIRPHHLDRVERRLVERRGRTGLRIQSIFEIARFELRIL